MKRKLPGPSDIIDTLPYLVVLWAICASVVLWAICASVVLWAICASAVMVAQRVF